MAPTWLSTRAAVSAGVAPSETRGGSARRSQHRCLSRGWCAKELSSFDLLLLCGVLGNIVDADVQRLIRALPQLCAPGARLIWTRHRCAPDLTPQIRDWLIRERFSEHAFISPGPDTWSVGAHTFHGRSESLEHDERLFTFVP